MGPTTRRFFRVLRVDPGRAVVYGSIRHPRRGSPIDITDPASPQRAEQQLREAGTYVDLTWALVLNGLQAQRTRLLVRTTRANYSPRALRFLTLPLGCSAPPTGWRSCGDRPTCQRRRVGEVEQASFAVISYVTPAGKPRSAVSCAQQWASACTWSPPRTSWMARQISRGDEVAVTVPIRRGWLPARSGA
jgi:hypothetical protein